MLRTTAQTALVAVALSTLPTTALACTVCIYSQFEYNLPYIGWWCLGITIWFLAIRTALDRLSSAVLWIFLALIAAEAFIGPWAFVILGGMALYTSIDTSLPKKRQKFSKRSQFAMTVISIIAFICIVTGLAISLHAKATRSDADFILQSKGAQGHIVLQRLIAEPTRSEAQLRKILANLDLSNPTHKYFTKEISEALEKLEKEKRNTAHGTSINSTDKSTSSAELPHRP
ncbi:MAG: hypothetical protein Q3M24_20405 [Candidatus Electrothrix aestuarii]|uniref:Uncharacterized protein n=1 Tax=Candidatus Electrothrix aestuarii TaxID=3062594 RepID=A0AAU8LU90_9BACT|nr:hypothetical protein [Candidatus Electrothrix aestuarii]